jgi:hypothetical protein
MNAIKCVLLSVGCAVMFSGCSSSQDKWQKKRPPLVKVAGIVTFNGEPLSKVTVALHPLGGNYAAFGQSGSNGRFTLETFDPGDGAVAGNYAVTVTKAKLEYEPDPVDPDTKPPLYQSEQSMIPDTYSVVATSGLTATIPSSGNADINLSLTGQPGELKIIADRRNNR